MAQKKEKQKESKKLVEDAPEAVENVELTASPSESKPTENLPSSAKSSQVESDAKHTTAIESPQAVLQAKLLLAARFTFITLLIGIIPYMLAPGFLLPGFNSPVVRTCALAALIWNLIGAALFANATTRGAKILLFFVFGIPLMTISLWWFWSILVSYVVGMPIK